MISPNASGIHSHRARWVFSIDSPPISNGTITSRGPAIVSVGPMAKNVDSGDVTDHGDVAILPLLVNPHTHLEFSDAQEPFGRPKMAFPDWIRTVIQSRLAIPQEERESRKVTAIREGVRESRMHGVGVVGEIATAPCAYREYAEANLETVLFREMLANDPSLVDERMSELDLHFEQCAASGLAAAVSPHAPYTVSIELLEACASIAARHSAPLAFHFAESAEEIELLETGGGPFRTLLQEAQAWFPGQFGGRKPVEYLERLTQCPRVAIIHGNYLGASERRLLSEHRNQMSLVYCPRTHEYFGHAPYPLGEYLACGVNVAIGTDSRASSPSLEIGRDLLAAAKLHPDVPKSTLLAMVTLKAAEAIGAAEFFGSIRPGKCAKLLAIRVDPGVRDPHEALFAAFEAGQTCVPVS